MCESDSINRVIIPPAVATDIVAQASRVYLRDCECRAKQQVCPRDNWEVCLLFEAAPQADRQNARLITTDEALSLLETTRRRRVIHQLFYTQIGQQITELCNCCTCCCSPLREMKQAGNYADQLRSGYVAVTDPSLCDDCGLCEEYCFFEARPMDNGMLSFVSERCFGCGRCLASCPQDAIRLEWHAGRGVAQVPGNTQV